MKLKFAIVFVFICLSLTISAQTITSKIDEYLSMRTELGRFSGAVLVAKDGKILIRKGYGLADVEKRIPYTPETRHAIASVSKMFTSAAALKLRDQGKLKLEGSIC